MTTDDRCLQIIKTFNPEAQCFRPIDSVASSLSSLSISPPDKCSSVGSPPLGSGGSNNSSPTHHHQLQNLHLHHHHHQQQQQHHGPSYLLNNCGIKSEFGGYPSLDGGVAQPEHYPDVQNVPATANMQSVAAAAAGQVLAAGGGKPDEEFSVILADVRKTCYSS